MEIKIPVDKLIFVQEEVEQEGIDRYIDKFENKEKIDKPYGRFCKHTNRYYVLNGHHKTYTGYFYKDIREIILRYDDCTKPDSHQLDNKDPCIIREDFYAFNGSINDIKVVNYDSLFKKVFSFFKNLILNRNKVNIYK